MALQSSDDFAVVTSQLRKTYRTFSGRKVTAVGGLDLKVPRGGVHGFLGPNGSGKTTTIRMLLGLVRPDSGSLTVLGRTIPKHLPDVIANIGAIVEQPKFYPYFSGRENLIQLAMAIGAPKLRVDEVIEAVGLTERARHRYKTYSLGMKQRLAIAATLLKDPELLIFDEPTNGLDPAGIREIRGTMRSLADQGKTVVVSSHILAEVEQVADTVSIIGRGIVIAEGRVDELLATQGSSRVRVGLAATELAAGLVTLRSAGFDARGERDHLVVLGAPPPQHVNRTLAVAGLYASELVIESDGLESLFLELTAQETPGGQQTELATPGGARDSESEHDATHRSDGAPSGEVAS